MIEQVTLLLVGGELDDRQVHARTPTAGLASDEQQPKQKT
jgi:hypothetical protein